MSYATETKIAWGVPRELIEEYGAVSAECAMAMARVARERIDADIGIGITGVAGPDPEEDKPPGTVHLGLAEELREPQSISYQFAQGREAVKRRAVTTALTFLRRTLLDRRGSRSNAS